MAAGRMGGHTSMVNAAPEWPSLTQRPLRRALVLLVAAMAVIGVLEIASAVTSEAGGQRWMGVAYVAASLVYVAAGVLAWARRPSNRFGSLIVFGGFMMLVGRLDAFGIPLLSAVSVMLATLPLAVLVHVLHAFPSGRLPSRASRLTVLAVYMVSLVLQAPLYLFTADHAPVEMLVVADRPDLAELGHLVQSGVGAAVMVSTTYILASRLRRAEPRRRLILAPLYGYGIVAVLFIPVSANLLPSSFSPDWVFWAQLVAVTGAPVAFTIALLFGGFARTGGIEELGAWLSTAEGSRSSLRTALARVLGDDSAQLFFWASARQAYVNADGDLVDLAADDQRGLVEIALAGERVGAINYDITLNSDPAPVRAAGRVIAIVVDRERVAAELRASRQAVRRSRARIVEAGDIERRRIARDLHDGLQMRLVLLAMQAQQVAAYPDISPDAHDAAIALRVGIDSAAAELRDLVHAVLPAALIERGLCAATEDLVDRLPIRTELEMTIADHSLPPVVESTAYFVVAEALTNALKHAQATALTVCLDRIGDHLRIQVTDDGVGGAHNEGGTRLRGLADRVDTLGGRLDVHSPRGHGTRITAELPCVS